MSAQIDRQTKILAVLLTVEEERPHPPRSSTLLPSVVLHCAHQKYCEQQILLNIFAIVHPSEIVKRKTGGKLSTKQTIQQQKKSTDTRNLRPLLTDAGYFGMTVTAAGPVYSVLEGI